MVSQDQPTDAGADPPRETATAAARIPRSVLLVGPDTTEVGGMATVVSQIRAMTFRGRYRPRLFALTRSSVPGEPVHRRLRRHLAHLARLRATAGRLNPAVVHIHTCSGFSFLRSAMDMLVVHRCRCPVILHIHGAAFDSFYQRQPHWRRALIRACLTRADCVIALSEEWKRRLVRMAPRASIVVIENAVEGSQPPRRQRPGGPCRFVLLARMDEWKGIDDLLEACALLAGQGTCFELALAGPAGTAGDAPTLRRKIAELDLSGAVRYVGVVQGSEKTKLLAWADVYVQPSHHEGMPISLLEAMAGGLAVVATTVGAVPEVLEHKRQGLLVPPHRADLLAVAMCEMTESAAQRARMAGAARALAVSRFSIDRFERELIALYDAMILAYSTGATDRAQPYTRTRRYQERCAIM